MAKRLTAQDGRAVDLLLNKAGATAMRNDVTGYATPSDDDQNSRLERVQSLLNLIHEWPAEEPPAGLVERTMARIEASVQGEPHQAAPRIHDPNGPMA